MTEVATGSPEASQSAGPYPGLKPFSEEESQFFFGRERDSEIIVANLRARRLTVLYGPSGVGKSSVLRAGVAASLRRRAVAARAKRGRAPFVPVVVEDWKDDPVAGILAAVERSVQDLVGDDTPGPPSTGDLGKDLLAWSEHFGGELLLILDQFEELFEYHREPGGKGSLDEQLPRVVSREALPVSLLISIREDALALLDDRFKRSVPGLLDSRLRIGHLDRESAREAIVKPIEHYNAEHGTAIEIESALVEEVLDQVTRGRVSLEQTGAGAVDGGESARGTVETPYLQLVLSRLWLEEQRAGSTVLRLETLERLGGAETIVRTHLDEALGSLPDDERDVAADVFRYLVTPSGTKIALRPADLASYAEHSEETITPVLRKLAERRIGILRPVAPPPGADSGPRYEIYHDVLAGAILDWRSRHAQTQLVREKELAEQHAREAQEREDREKRRARMFRGLLIGSLVLLGATVAALVFGLVQRSEAQEALRRVHSIALGGRAAAESDPVVAALTGLEGYRLFETREARDATLTQVQKNAAIPMLLIGHTRGVNGIAFTPDSKVLASGSSDGTVRLWDAVKGEALGAPLRMGVDDPPIIDSVAISQDGSLLAAAGDDGPVRLWDVRDPRRPTRLPSVEPYGDEANVIAFGGGATPVLAAGGDDATITLWRLANPRKPQRLQKLSAGDDDVLALAFAPGGRMLASGDDFGDTRLWRVLPGDGARLLTKKPFTRPDVFGVQALAFSPRGDVLVAGGEGRDPHESPVVVWDVSRPAAPKDVRTPAGHADTVRSVGFDGKGSRLVSGGSDGNVLVWDTDSWRSFGPPRTHDYTLDIRGVEFSPDGKIVASADSRGTIKLWRLTEPRALGRTLGWSGRMTWDLAFVPGGVVAAASGKAGIELWRPIRDSAVGPPPEPQVIEAESDPDGTSYAVATYGSLLIGSTGYTFGIWDLTGGRARPVSRSDSDEHANWIVDLAVSADGETVATGDFDGTIVVWDISDRRRIRAVSSVESHAGREVEGLAFHPSKPLLVSSGTDGTVRFWDVSDPKTPEELGDRPLVAHDGESVWALALSADGNLLATGGGNLRAALWNIEDASNVTRVGRAFLHTNDPLGLSFSPLGDLLAVADGESGVVLYDIASRRPLGFGVVGHVGADATYEAVAFDDEAATLYTAGQLNPVVAWASNLWTSDRETLREDVCRIVRRDLTEEEWDEMFSDTQLEGRYRRTCTDERG